MGNSWIDLIGGGMKRIVLRPVVHNFRLPC